MANLEMILSWPASFFLFTSLSTDLQECFCLEVGEGEKISGRKRERKLRGDTECNQG